MKEKRIEILDSFRFLAIISVILFHYTYRWTIPAHTSNYYPFKNFYGDLFSYGSLGVHFFFMISGFVISYTLENTSGLTAFFKNRFIRLFPPMLFWSILTYLVCLNLDNTRLFYSSRLLRNFLPSLTFINPKIWADVLKHNFEWLNGSYWSLWVEVLFYFLSSVLFFIDKKRFFRNILVITTLLMAQNYLIVHFLNADHVKNISPVLLPFLTECYKANQLLVLPYFIQFFTLGVIAHHLYKRMPIRLNSLTGFCAAFIVLYMLYSGVIYQVRIAYLIMIILFLLMIYKREFLFFLENPLFRRIGVISYSVYLAHENIGVLLMNKYGGYLGRWSPLAVPVMIIIIIFLSELSYRFIEQNVGRWLKKMLFKPKPTGRAPVLE